MNDHQIAEYANKCWSYAKSSGHASYSESFERWFKQRAKTLYALDEKEVIIVWNAALKIHS